MYDQVVEQRVISCAIDDIALASLVRQQKDQARCNLCDDAIEGQASASGLFMWTRGDDVRFEEPPLCPECASTIAVTAFVRWSCDDGGWE